MSNKYLKHYGKKRIKSSFAGDYFQEGGWGDRLTPDWLETPMQYYTKKVYQAGNTAGLRDGDEGKGNIINLTGQGLVLTTMAGR